MPNAPCPPGCQCGKHRNGFGRYRALPAPPRDPQRDAVEALLCTLPPPSPWGVPPPISASELRLFMAALEATVHWAYRDRPDNLEIAPGCEHILIPDGGNGD